MDDKFAEVDVLHNLRLLVEKVKDGFVGQEVVVEGRWDQLNGGVDGSVTIGKNMKVARN